MVPLTVRDELQLWDFAPQLSVGERSFAQLNRSHPPIITVGQPITITPPWAVISPIRAAGRPPIITVADPLTITSGGPTQAAISVTRAAGKEPINTVGQPLGNMGPP